MIKFIILLIITVILEMLISNLFKNVLPLFVVGIILLNVDIKDKYYYLILLIFGVFVSIIYSSSVFLYGFIYLIIGLVVKMINNKKSNFFKYIIMNFLISYMYLLLLFIYTYYFNNITVLKLNKYYVNSMIVNLIYFILSYIVCLVISKKNKHIGKIGDINDYKRRL